MPASDLPLSASGRSVTPAEVNGGTLPVPVAAASGKHFVLARSYAHVRERDVVPIAASELANVAQDLPLLFRKSAETWEVVGVVAAQALQRPVVDARGHWQGEYAPMVLRLHPFGLDGGTGLSVDMRGLREPPEGHPFMDAAGAPSERLRRVAASAEAAREGIRRLGERVLTLDRAGLLAPAPLLFSFARPCPAVAGLFGVDGRRLAALAPAALAALVDATPSAMDLAVASMFSTRRLAASIIAPISGEDELAARIDAGLRAGEAVASSPVAPVPPPAQEPAAGNAPSLGYAIDASVSLDFSGLPF